MLDPSAPVADSLLKKVVRHLDEVIFDVSPAECEGRDEDVRIWQVALLRYRFSGRVRASNGKMAGSSRPNIGGCLVMTRTSIQECLLRR